MILVSRWFRRDVNRWLNIVASVLTLLYVLGGGNFRVQSHSSYAVCVSATRGWSAMLGITLAGMDLAQCRSLTYSVNKRRKT